MGAIGEQAAQLQREWETDPRWAGITRDYSARDVIRLRGRVAGEHSLARRGASRLWDLLHQQDAAPVLGAVVDDRAAEAPRAGLPAIYLPSWQAGDGSLAGAGYPGQPPHPDNPMPHLVRRINNALLSADPPARPESPADGSGPARRVPPVVADAGCGAVLGSFDLMTAMIEAGAAGVRFEDQLSPGGARADLGGKVLVPTGQHIETLTAARLAADVLGVPSLIIARSGAHAASLLTSDIDERDEEFLPRRADGGRVPPGRAGLVRVRHPPTRVRALRRRAVAGDPGAGPGRGPRVRLHHPLPVPGQAARLQLPRALHRADARGRRVNREVPVGAGGDGLPIPVGHPGRVPQSGGTDARTR